MPAATTAAGIKEGGGADGLASRCGLLLGHALATAEPTTTAGTTVQIHFHPLGQRGGDMPQPQRCRGGGRGSHNCVVVWRRGAETTRAAQWIH